MSDPDLSRTAKFLECNPKAWIIDFST